MKNYQEFFKNKKITVVGLGLLGKRLGDILFLLECGAEVTVTDLKQKEALQSSIETIEKFIKSKNIKTKVIYTLGGHKFEDFENKDFILKGQGVPLDSPYIAHAREKGIPIEMDESLFMKLASDVKIIGVTGTRGKSTTTTLIYEILSASANASVRRRKSGKVFLGGNIKGTAALPLLKKVSPPAGGGDVMVFELSSWQLQGFGEDKISPHISVFTNFMPDHLNYYNNDLDVYFKDKSYIYKFQKPEDYLIIGERLKKLVKNYKSKLIVVKKNNIPKSWKIKILGEHNLENISYAVEVARILKIKENIIKKAVESFTGVSGRLEFVKEIKGVKIYNDTNATTPDATVVALNSFSALKSGPKSVLGQSKVILIMGGMDKGIDVSGLNKILPKKTKKIFLTPGSGSDKIDGGLASVCKVDDLKEAVKQAWQIAKKGDIILFSPAFASFNMFKNEYDRGEQFLQLVKKLK